MTDTAEPTVEVMPPARPWEALPEGDYAIAELMGHTVLVGRITEIDKFGAKMAAIEVLFGGQLLPAIFQGGSSFYRLTPCSREVAWSRQHKAAELWSLPESIKAIVPQALLPAPEPPSVTKPWDARHDTSERSDGTMDDDEDDQVF